MEEDIKVIKEIIYSEDGKRMNYIDISDTPYDECKEFIQAIENLINRNKQLEQIEKEHKKENGELREELNRQINAREITEKYIDEKFIEKSIIEEILNKYKYTELGNDEEIINFYKELRGLIKERR